MKIEVIVSHVHYPTPRPDLLHVEVRLPYPSSKNDPGESDTWKAGELHLSLAQWQAFGTLLSAGVEQYGKRMGVELVVTGEKEAFAEIAEATRRRENGKVLWPFTASTSSNLTGGAHARTARNSATRRLTGRRR